MYLFNRLYQNICMLGERFYVIFWNQNLKDNLLYENFKLEFRNHTNLLAIQSFKYRYKKNKTGIK